MPIVVISGYERSGDVTDILAIETQSVVPGPDHALRGSEQTTRVAFFTDTHRIIADVETGPRRLVEVLRDVSRAHLDLKHVRLARIADPTEDVATSPRGVLQKADIRLAAILSEAHRSERRLYGYVAKATVRILAVLAGCEVVGEMHLPEGTKDGIVGYMKLRDTFLHIGDAKVTFSLGSNTPSEVNTVVVNRTSIHLLCLVE
jgi:hypothetical protein